MIGAVRPDQLDLPTPCDELDVGGLLGHLVMALERVAEMGRGGEPMTITPRTDVPDDGWRTAWLSAAHDVQRAWSDDTIRSAHL